MQIACSRCQNLNRADAKFCLSCGAPLAALQVQPAASPAVSPTATLSCPQCGKAVSVKAKFCNYCGHPFSQAPAAVPSVVPAPSLPATPPPPYAAPTYTPTHRGLSRRQQVILIVAGVIVGAILGAAVFVVLRSSFSAQLASPTATAMPSATPIQAILSPTGAVLQAPGRECHPAQRQKSDLQKYFVEKPDETLQQIATQHHMEVAELMRLNGLTGDYRPQPGDCLLVRTK